MERLQTWADLPQPTEGERMAEERGYRRGRVDGYYAGIGDAMDVGLPEAQYRKLERHAMGPLQQWASSRDTYNRLIPPPHL